MNNLPLTAEDPQGRMLELNRERWSHIVSRHGELSNKQDEVNETVRCPDKVVSQSSRNDTLHYFREEDGLKFNDHICVVVNIKREFIVTAYPTSQKKA